MATYGATHRPSSNSPSASVADHETDEKKDSTRKIQSATDRIIRNLSYFRLYYILFVWVILCITLVPEQIVSLIFLVAMSTVTYLYSLLLYLLPNNLVVPYKTIDKRLVFALLGIATVVELILTGAAIHLIVTLGASIPVILIHAVLSKMGDDHFATEEGCAAGELVVPFVYKNIDDAKAVDLV